MTALTLDEELEIGKRSSGRLEVQNPIVAVRGRRRNPGIALDGCDSRELAGAWVEPARPVFAPRELQRHGAGLRQISDIVCARFGEAISRATGDHIRRRLEFPP